MRQFMTFWICLFVVTRLYAEPVQLRYDFTHEPEFAYQLELEVDEDPVLRNFTSTPVFQTKVNDKGEFVFTVTGGNLKEETKFKRENVRGILRPMSLPTSPIPYRATVDERGRILNQQGGATLPYALGGVQSFVLEPWPEAASEEWERTTETTISISRSSFLRRRLIGGDEELERLQAEERITYLVKSTTEDEVVIARSYRFATIEQAGDGPRMELAHAGDLHVNRKTGIPVQYVGTGAFISREDTESRKIPLRIGFVRISAEELGRLKEQWASEAADRVAPPSPEERTELLAALQSTETQVLQAALIKLAAKRPVAEDPEMAAALAKLLESQHNFIQTGAAQGLAKWATPAEAETLLLQLGNDSILIRNAIQEAVVRLKLRAALPVLAQQMEVDSQRSQAGRTLRAFGAEAEADVLPLLEHKTTAVRIEACRVLTEIGTAQSLKPLGELAANDPDNTAKFIAKQAVETIKKRN